MFNLIGEDLKDDVVGYRVCLPGKSKELVINPDSALFSLDVLVEYH